MSKEPRRAFRENQNHQKMVFFSRKMREITEKVIGMCNMEIAHVSDVY